MRIRKNARLVSNGGLATSSAAATSSSSTTSTSSFLVCQLNRSPWDIIDASSLQGDGDDAFAVPPSDSLLISGHEPMELSFEYVEKQPQKQERDEDAGIIAGFEQEEDDMNNIGWRLDESILAPPPRKKIGPPPPYQPPPAPKRRGRPRKAATSTPPSAMAANPDEFYYYSGFGPKWGIKRRGGDKSFFATAAVTAPVAECEGMESTTPGSSSTTQMLSEDEKQDHFHNNADNNKTKTKMKMENNNGVDLLELDSVADGEIDYIEDDDDDDDELYGGGRRIRKPIKARSLKSLM